MSKLFIGRPRWRNDVPPADVIAEEDEEEVEVTCAVEGIPEPTVEWFRNGEPVNGCLLMIIVNLCA